MKRIIFAAFCIFGGIQSEAQTDTDLHQLISGLDTLRSSLKIPGMSVALMKGDSILFERGFGYADLEKKQAVTPATTFRVASITKTFTSTIIMQLVEQGKLDLRTPVSAFGVDLNNPQITVKNLLTHTSEGNPGQFYQYSGYRFGKLGIVLEKLTGKPFYQLLMENIIGPLPMPSSAPGIKPEVYFSYTKQNASMTPFFVKANANLAKPYALNGNEAVTEIKYLDEFGAFGGLITNAHDLLAYSSAIDRNRFVSANTQSEIFTPNRTTDGKLTPYGLGWFTQNYRGIDFYWHYGQTQGESGLFVKVPSLNLTFVVLTNIETLSQPFPLGDGDLFTSPAGQLFYRYCINQNKDLHRIDYFSSIPEISHALTDFNQNTFRDFYNKELISQATVCLVRNDTVRARQIYQLYAQLNFKDSNIFHGKEIIADINQVGINQDISRSFILTQSTRLEIYGVGENCSGDFSSWCDYGWIEDATGKTIWQMQGQPAIHAGGAWKNQKIVQSLELPSGKYSLRYRSDAGHAYNNWDSAPPENFFWGITVFSADKAH